MKTQSAFPVSLNSFTPTRLGNSQMLIYDDRYIEKYKFNDLVRT